MFSSLFRRKGAEEEKKSCRKNGFFFRLDVAASEGSFDLSRVTGVEVAHFTKNSKSGGLGRVYLFLVFTSPDTRELVWLRAHARKNQTKLPRAEFG